MDEIEKRLRTRARALEQAKAERDRAIREASRAGVPQPQIAKLVGLSKQRVYQIVSGSGVQVSGPKP